MPKGIPKLVVLSLSIRRGFPSSTCIQHGFGRVDDRDGRECEGEALVSECILEHFPNPCDDRQWLEDDAHALVGESSMEHTVVFGVEKLGNGEKGDQDEGVVC